MEKSIFRAYDVRGVYGKTLTDKDMGIIGNSLARFLKEDRIVIARDPRLSSESLSKAFVNGFIKFGKDVTDVGMVPLGAGSLYAWKKRFPFAYITGSHLTKEWNGIKFFYRNAVGFQEEDNNKVRDLSLEGEVVESEGKEGKVEKADTKSVVDEYVDFMLSKIKPKRKLRIVIDCGNGAAGAAARKLFERGGFEVDMVFEEPDGNFPNRSPDNFEDPLTEAKKRVGEADFGIAYDGDGDRAVVINQDGNTLTPEQTSYIMLGELLKEADGPVILNVECTRVIDDIAGEFGREVKRIRVGHTFLMNAVNKFKASFGAERSGHYVIPSIFPADDSLAVSYYFACVVSAKEEPLSELIEKIPSYPFQRINFDCDDEKKFMIVDKVKDKLEKEFRGINTLDGVRVDMEDGWVLIRASNTSPMIRLTMEGKDEDRFEKIKDRFSKMVKEAIDSHQ